MADVVVARAGADLDEADIGKSLRETLAAYKRPKRVVLREALPRNAMGKVEKAVLRRELADSFSAR